MKRLIGGLMTAVLMTWTVGQGFPSAQAGKFTVSVDRVPPGSALSLAMNGGKIGTGTTSTTATDGTATMVLDFANMGKVEGTTVDVYTGKCPDGKMKIWLVEHGQPVPPDDGCDRKPVGAFLWGHSNHLTIHWGDGISTGMSTTTRNLLIGGGAAGTLAAIIGATSGGDKTTGATTPTTTTSSSTSTTTSSTTTSSTTTSSTTTTTTTTTTTAGTANNFAGRYTGSGTATINSCGFSATTAISATLTVTDNGQAIVTWAKTHTNAGITFTFTNVHLTITSPTQASFDATTTQVVGGANYNVHDVASINNVTMNLTQTFGRTDGGCTVVYQMVLSRG